MTVEDDPVRVARKPGVALSRTGDQALLVDDEGGSVHVVNRTAARVWELCDGSPTVESVVESFARDYQLAPATARSDIAHILDSFRGLGLVELGGSSSNG